MAANLIQQQREAENLTDEELLYFIQNGSPHINQIILLGVADDRARQRQAPQANQPPMPTIKDQKMQQLAGPSPFSGIGSIEQPQQYADGGIVGYANGGLVGYQDGGFYDPDDPDDPELPSYSFGIQYPDEPSVIEHIVGRRLPTLEDIYDFFGGSQSGPRYHGRSGALIPDRSLPQRSSYDPAISGSEAYYGKHDKLGRHSLPTTTQEMLQPEQGGVDLDVFRDRYIGASTGTSMGPFRGITAPKMEEMDVRAQYAPLAELTEQLGIQTEGEAMRDRLAEQRVGQMSARRKRSQQLQDAEMRGLPFGYAARIALGQEGPSLQEGIMSLIGRREAEREAIDQGVFEIQDLQAQRQAALERGALTSAIALESRIADATVKNMFDVAKINADAELRTGIENLEQEVKLKIAQGNQDAQRLAASLRGLSGLGSGESQEDYAELMRAAAASLEAIVAASAVLTEEQKEQAAAMSASLIQIAATQIATPLLQE